jgi:hypothetical protein
MRPGDEDLAQHGDELRAVAPLARGDDDGQGLLPPLDGQVELAGQPAAGPAEGMAGGLGAARAVGRLLLPGAVPPRAGGVLVRPRGARVHRDIPGHVPRRVGEGLQRGHDERPGAVPLPAAEQPVGGLPRAVLRRGVPPRCAGPGPPPDPFDELPPRPLRRASPPSSRPAAVAPARSTRDRPGHDGRTPAGQARGLRYSDVFLVVDTHTGGLATSPREPSQ